MKAKEIERKIREILSKNNKNEKSKIFLFETKPGTFVVEYDDGDIDFSKLKFNKEGTPKFSFTITGGLNGSGDWTTYLKDLKEKFKELEDETGLEIVIEKLQNDIADDVWIAQCFLYDTNHVIIDSKPKKILNPKIWNEDKSLKPEIKDKVEEVVDKFENFLADLNIDIDVDDILLVGSNASYNYNAKSDLDIHILVSEVDEAVMRVYESYKTLFNKTYKIKFNRIHVEIYVDNDINELGSKAIYSIYKGWIKETNVEDIKEVDISEDMKVLVDEYKQVVELRDVEKIKELIKKVYDMRREAFENDGEFSKNNLLFKEFRKKGYLKKLKELQVKLESKALSIGDVIKETNEGWVVYSEKGKVLSKPYKDKKDAEKRLKQIEMFKHMKKDSDEYKGYIIKDVRGHFEIYKDGKFVSSADTLSEAKQDIEDTIAFLENPLSKKQKVAEPLHWKVYYINSVDKSSYIVVSANNKEDAKKMAKRELGNEIYEFIDEPELISSKGAKDMKVKDEKEEIEVVLEGEQAEAVEKAYHEYCKCVESSEEGKIEYSDEFHNLLNEVSKFTNTSEAEILESFKQLCENEGIKGKEPKEVKDSEEEEVSEAEYEDLIKHANHGNVLDLYDGANDAATGLFEKVYEELNFPRDRTWIVHPSVLKDDEKMEQLYQTLRERVLEMLRDNQYVFDTPRDFKYGDHDGTETVMKIFDIHKHITFDAKHYPDFLGYINGTLDELDPKSFVEKVKNAGESLHTNRIALAKDDKYIVYHIVVELLHLNGTVYVDIVKETWKPKSNDLDTFEAYIFEEEQERILSEKCGSGEDKWDKAIKVIEDFKKKDIKDSKDSFYDQIDDVQMYVYQFPRSMTKEDLDKLETYGLELLGKVGENGFQPDDYLVKGSLRNLNKYCHEYLDYEMHPDYLYKEDEIDLEDILVKDELKEDSNKLMDLVGRCKRILMKYLAKKGYESMIDAEFQLEHNKHDNVDEIVCAGNPDWSGSRLEEDAINEIDKEIHKEYPWSEFQWFSNSAGGFWTLLSEEPKEE